MAGGATAMAWPPSFLLGSLLEGRGAATGGGAGGAVEEATGLAWGFLGSLCRGAGGGGGGASPSSLLGELLYWKELASTSNDQAPRLVS